MDTIGVSEANVVGNSAGGHIAARLVLTYPQRVERLVLVDSWGQARAVIWFFKLASLHLFGDTLETSNVFNTRALVNSIFHEPASLNNGLVRNVMRVRNLPGDKKAVLKAMEFNINLGGLKKIVVLDQLHTLSIPLLII